MECSRTYILNTWSRQGTFCSPIPNIFYVSKMYWASENLSRVWRVKKYFLVKGYLRCMRVRKIIAWQTAMQMKKRMWGDLAFMKLWTVFIVSSLETHLAVRKIEKVQIHSPKRITYKNKNLCICMFKEIIKKCDKYLSTIRHLRYEKICKNIRASLKL